ncbi:hypothetical protein [Microbacterium suaedae]|uniref:hypothetical protein n=1 Tax=Microbacterium suaedae TaxID=2067813 RepID=UPI000DA219BD|nr:hypothetical protein [Microbacterium suaedae]
MDDIGISASDSTIALLVALTAALIGTSLVSHRRRRPFIPWSNRVVRAVLTDAIVVAWITFVAFAVSSAVTQHAAAVVALGLLVVIADGTVRHQLERRRTLTADMHPEAQA